MTATAAPTPAYEFKCATEPWELEQVHRLNYRTFVEEIPQHAANERQLLVDRFDAENRYFICRRGARVVGMIAVRGERPWSLDAKLPDVDHHLPAGRRFCEIRLLAVDPAHRGGAVLRGLMAEVARDAVARGYSGAVISGTVRQAKLYEHIGFVPFGPLVGTRDAAYQPMYITLDSLRALRAPLARADEAARPGPRSFLPGPVDVHPDVLRALGDAPGSHRDDDFMHEVAALREMLCAMVGARRVAILLGSGTLANDVVAAQLAARAGGARGLVFANGEFGERLADHARRAGLAFDVATHAWGDAFDAAAVDAALARHRPAWVWMVHLETSASVVNDLAWLAHRGRERGILVAADCVSAVGVLPVDAGAVTLATAVSGKGIGGVPGLALVFHDGTPAAGDALPRYLDLALYEDTGSVPFTQSSNLVRALAVAARRTLLRTRHAGTARDTGWLREALRARGHLLVGDGPHAAPGIVTVDLRDEAASLALGDALLARGHAVSYRSAYLRRRGWLQVAVMGECSRAALQELLVAWDEALAPR